MINEGGRTLRRYNANHADLLIQAEHELSPGTILYPDIAAFKTFTAWWSPAALRKSQDPSWTRPDVVHAGVFILGYFDNEMLDAAVVGHGDAAVDSCDVAVVPPSISSSCGSGQAAGTVSSFGGVPVRSHDFQPHESAVAVAAEYLTSSEDLSESEQVASIAARSGSVPPLGEFVNDY